MNEFMKYVLTSVCGQPSGRRWWCPFGDHKSASIDLNDPMDGCSIKWRCYQCCKWGDEYDLLKKKYPDEEYGSRKLRVERLRAEFEAGRAAGDPGCSFTPKGRCKLDPSRGAVLSAFAALTTAERAGIAAAYEACEAVTRAGGECPEVPPEHRGWIGRAVAVGDRYGVLHPDDVADLVLECVSMARFIRETDARHRAECTEEDCCTIVCRAARGLPPLPIEELRRQSREDDEQQWANLIRVAKGSARQSLERQAREHPAGVRGALRDLRRGRARW